MTAEPTPGTVAVALLDPTRRVRPSEIRALTDSRSPGLYAWFADPSGALAITAGLGLPVEAGLIYAGQAGAGDSEATLGSRIGGNHIGGRIHASTFRLTLASALRAPLQLEPVDGILDREAEGRLTEWMLEHLVVAIDAFDDRGALDALETEVIERLDPPLNLAKRPKTPVRTRLTELRRAFARPTRDAAGIGRGSRTEAGGPQEAPARPPRASRPAVHRTPTATSGDGPTPEELARELGLPNAKSLRGYLRRRFPRQPEDLRSRWGPLEPDVVAHVRSHFRRR